MARETGRLQVAQEYLDHGLQLARQSDRVEKLGQILNGLGEVALLKDDLSGAERRFRECLELGRSTGIKGLIRAGLAGVGQVGARNGQHGVALAGIRMSWKTRPKSSL